jgi:hypothetical protein
LKVTQSNAFRLSRIEAQGWNAAHRFMAIEMKRPNQNKITTLNPHPADPERARWQTGFQNALNAMETR